MDQCKPLPRAHPGELREPGGHGGGHGSATAGGVAVVALARHHVRERGGDVLEDAAQLQNADDVRGAGVATR